MGVTQRQTEQLQPRRLREWVPGSSLLQTSNFSFLQLPKLQDQPTCQDGRAQDQAELPRGLRGVDQQADQHGILRLLRLSLHELLLQPRRPSSPWFRRSLKEGVERGARPRHEVDGVPDQERRPRRLPGHRQALESEYLSEQVEGIKAVGDLITKMKRAGDGLGLHI